MNALLKVLCGAALLAPAADAAAAPTYSSAEDAQQAIARLLPQTTRANPEYTTKQTGVRSRWLTDGVTFTRGSDGVEAAMAESFTQDKDGKIEKGTHHASFKLADVSISEFEEPGDVTPEGKAARGILFKCNSAGCVADQWNDKAAKADKTDVSIQDDAARAELLSAWTYLQSHAK